MAGMNDFIQKVSSDKELEGKFKALLQDNSVADKKAAVLAFAKDCGVELTADDMKEYSEANKKEGELTEEELDAVAGGGFWTDFAQGFCSVLATLGFCFWT